MVEIILMEIEENNLMSRIAGALEFIFFNTWWCLRTRNTITVNRIVVS